MKRWLLAVLVVLALGAVGVFWYLGMLSGRSKDPEVVEAPATVAVSRGDVQQTVTAPGRLVSMHEVVLTAQAGGRMEEVVVREGDTVRAGDVLARMDTGPLMANVAQAQMDLDLAQARHDRLLAGPTDAELLSAQLDLLNAQMRVEQLQSGPSGAELAAAKASLAEADAELARLESLPDPAALAEAQVSLDRATVALGQAQSSYDQIRDRADAAMLPQAAGLQNATIDFEAAQAALERVGRKASPAQLEAARARQASAIAALEKIEKNAADDELAIAELQKQQALVALRELDEGPGSVETLQAAATVQTASRALETARSSLKAATLTAPFDGVVLEVMVDPGEEVMASTPAFRLTDPSALEVRASVVEEDLPLLQAGQAVELFFDARPDAEVQGRVSRIVPERLTGDRPLYAVFIESSRLPGELVKGMSADASIVIDANTEVLRLPRALVRARADGTAKVRVWAEGQTEERLVQVGLRGDMYVELLGGLREGELVVAQ